MGKGYYVLVSNGTHSKVHATENAFVAAPIWFEGAEIEGDWDQLIPLPDEGELYLYNADSGFTWEDVDDEYWLSRPFFMDETFHTTVNTSRNFEFDQVYPGAVGILLDSTARSNSQIATLGSPGSGWGGVGFTILNTTGGVFAEITDQKQGWLVGTAIAAFPDYTDVANPNFTVLQATTTLTLNFGGNPAGRDHDYHGRVRLVIDKSLQDPPDGPSGTPNICQAAYSDDHGQTWYTPELLGDPPGEFGGADCTKLGSTFLAGYAGQVAKATAGGTFSDYGDPMPEGGQPNAIFIPRYMFGSTASNATTTPDYLVASAFLTEDDEALWKVTDDGTTFTDITPHDGTNYGIAVSPHCLAMPHTSGSIIAALLKFGSLPKLAISINAGASWTIYGPLDDQARQVTFRHGDTLLKKQLFGGGGNPFYSPNRGATIIQKSYPGDQNEDPVLSVSVYG